MDRKQIAEKFEDVWDEIRSRSYYIVGVLLLVFFPFLLVTPGSILSEPFSILNSFYSGGSIPILSDLFNLGQEIGLFGKNAYLLNIIALCLIWAIFAASWDFLSGYTGQVSFGHAIFWGFSAYVTFWVATGVPIGITFDPLDPIVLGIPILDEILGSLIFLINAFIDFIFIITNEILVFIFGSNFMRPPLAALVVGAFTSAIFAVGIGFIALRVKGPYLALVTLLLPLIASQIVVIMTDLFGPKYGIPFISGPFVVERISPFDLPPDLMGRASEINELNFFIFVLVIFFISVFLMMLVAYSRIGLAFQSIREDEDAAESLGINVRFYKILAFAGSAFFAGLAGGLFSQYLRFTGPSFFASSFSFSIIIMCVIGGIGSISGGVVGAFVLTILLELFLKDIFHGVQSLDLLGYGILLIVTLRYMPFGLARASKDQKKACIVGVLFAISWTIIPIGEGWGTNIIASLSSSLPLGTDVLSNILSVSFETLTSYMGKVDYMGQITSSLSDGDILMTLSFVLIFTFGLIASVVFFFAEIIGLFFMGDILGLSRSWTYEDLIKAKFLIYVAVGIPFAFYLPKAFKKVRLRFWGVWPSAGRYEPD